MPPPPPPLGLQGAFRGRHLWPGGRKPSAAVAVKTDVAVPFLCHFKTPASHRSLNGSVESLTTFCRRDLGFGGLEATKAPPANQRPGCEGGRRQCCFLFFFFFFLVFFYSFVFRFILEKVPPLFSAVFLSLIQPSTRPLRRADTTVNFTFIALSLWAFFVIVVVAL